MNKLFIVLALSFYLVNSIPYCEVGEDGCLECDGNKCVSCDETYYVHVIINLKFHSNI